MIVSVNGNRVELKHVIGEGGEARIYYNPGEGSCYKIYKTPDDPDYAGDTEQARNNRAGAEARIANIDARIREFPSRLRTGEFSGIKLAWPQRVVKDYSTSKPVGISMQYLAPPMHPARRAMDAKYMAQHGLAHDRLRLLLRHLHLGLVEMHASNIVIGDLNDLNVLFSTGGYPGLVDIDSWQYGSFTCRSFTQRFVDPRLCDQNQNHMVMIKPFDKQSDYYAAAVIAFQTLFRIGPFDGVHRPKTGKRVPHEARALVGFSVFRDDVVKPKFAQSFDMYPDDLLDFFSGMFAGNNRECLPDNLLANMAERICRLCHRKHYKTACPWCVPGAVVSEVITVTGNVTSTEVYKAPPMSGIILEYVTNQRGLKYYTYDGAHFFREGGRSIWSTATLRRGRICGEYDCYSDGGVLYVKRPGEASYSLNSQLYRFRDITFETNSTNVFWIEDDCLKTSKPEELRSVAHTRIGSIMPNQTKFWVGEKFGFGFYRAAMMTEFFVFGFTEKSLKDGVKIPRLTGELVDADAKFGGDKCWFFVSEQIGGETYNRCFLLSNTGEVLASAEEVAGSDTWLSSIRGKCAAGDFLFSANEFGLYRVNQNGTELQSEQNFPGTAPYMQESSELVLAADGLYVVDADRIQLLKIKREPKEE